MGAPFLACFARSGDLYHRTCGPISPLERLANITKSFLLTAPPPSVTHCNDTMTNIPQARLKNDRPMSLRLKNLGEVEQLVMDYLWTHGPSSSEPCCAASKKRVTSHTRPRAAHLFIRLRTRARTSRSAP